MRRFAPLLALTGVLVVPLVAQAATTHQVDIRENAYRPPDVSAASGDTVRWTNMDLVRHTVTFSGTSHEVLPGQSITITFQAPGTYRYYCDDHPEMRGSVAVQSASGTSSTSTTRAPTTTSTTQEPRGSAVTAPPDTSSTTTTSTTPTSTTTSSSTSSTTSVPDDGGGDGEPSDDVMAYDGPDGNPDDVDGPGAVAAALLLATAGGAFFVTRRAAL